MSEIRVGGNVSRQSRALAPLLERWPPLSVLIACVLVLWFSLPTLTTLHASASESADYQHGYLLLLLTAALVVRELRSQVLAATPSWLGSVVLVALTLVVLVGHTSTSLIVAQMALPALWIAAIWAFAGAPNARRFALPLAYLYLAIPIWNLLVDPMRELTIRVVSIWIRAAGLPAFIEGNLIHVPTGTFEVEGGCAGLRYALVAASLAVFSCMLQRRRLMHAMALTAFALLLALVGNWLRVFFTVAAGLSPEAPIPLMVHNHHTLFGWVLFAVFMLPFFYVDRRLPIDSPKVATADPRASGSKKTTLLNRSAAYFACASLALVGWAMGRAAPEAEAPSGAAAFAAPQIPGWEREGRWQDARAPVFVGVSAETAGWYVNGPMRVGAYVAHYSSQRQAREVVFDHNQPTGQAGTVIARRTLTAVTPAGVGLPFRELEVSDSRGQRRLVWLEYRVAGRLTADDLLAKALQVGGAIRGRRDAQALVLTANCDNGCEAARSWLSDFAIAASQALYDEAERSVASP